MHPEAGLASFFYAEEDEPQLTGHVFLDEIGEPVSGASVLARFVIDTGAGKFGLPPRVRESRTDDAGAFRIPLTQLELGGEGDAGARGLHPDRPAARIVSLDVEIWDPATRLATSLSMGALNVSGGIDLGIIVLQRPPDVILDVVDSSGERIPAPVAHILRNALRIPASDAGSGLLAFPGIPPNVRMLTLAAIGHRVTHVRLPHDRDQPVRVVMKRASVLEVRLAADLPPETRVRVRTTRSSSLFRRPGLLHVDRATFCRGRMDGTHPRGGVLWAPDEDGIVLLSNVSTDEEISVALVSETLEVLAEVQVTLVPAEHRVLDLP